MTQQLHPWQNNEKFRSLDPKKQEMILQLTCRVNDRQQEQGLRQTDSEGSICSVTAKTSYAVTSRSPVCISF